LKAAIEELRKGERVTSASAETYNSLNKYAKNLNELHDPENWILLLVVTRN
jgi:ATP-dependent Clp protease ATP-binding subunit ClpB